MAPAEQIKVAIVGGGIGGLCLAAGLIEQPHLDVHIYESVPEYKDIGAGLALHMNAIKAMDLIGPKVKKAYFDTALNMASEADEEISTQVTLASGPNTGAVVAELGKAKGRKTVARADLLGGLQGLIPKDKLSFDKRLASISDKGDTVEVTFKDGTNVEADCLISADGVHSMTRSYLLGADHPATPPQNHDGWQIYRTFVPADEAKKVINEKYTRTVPIMCGPRGHINCMPLHKGKDISAGVAVRGAIKPGQTDTPPLRKEDFAGYSKEAQEIVEVIAGQLPSLVQGGANDPTAHLPRHVRQLADPRPRPRTLLLPQPRLDDGRRRSRRHALCRQRRRASNRRRSRPERTLRKTHHLVPNPTTLLSLRPSSATTQSESRRDKSRLWQVVRFCNPRVRRRPGQDEDVLRQERRVYK